jgi:hypothetical protein
MRPFLVVLAFGDGAESAVAGDALVLGFVDGDAGDHGDNGEGDPHHQRLAIMLTMVPRAKQIEPDR